MTTKEKLRTLFDLPDWIEAGLRTDIAVSLYLAKRRSRLGIKNILKHLYRNRLTTILVKKNEAEESSNITFRVASSGDWETLDEVFGEGIYDLTLVPFDPDRICDFGAHIGLFTILTGDYKNAERVAVEPEPNNFQLLRQNLDSNGIQASTVNAAVGDSEEPVWLSCHGSNAHHVSEKGDLRIEQVLGSSVIQGSNNLLLKIDVEGAEWKVLHEIIPHLPSSCAMFIEVHEGESAIFRLKHILKGERFSVRILRQRGVCTDCFAVRQ